ncbi:alpha-amylase family glycosyl hydrolase [Mariniflexile ostreae]|uniref:Alpha-amylase family glycosyl hydrolase n=1 Tax=Mariniflexile ostreae TaxID=1520892 RepID=A0ABV5F831_9FLAO
MKKTILLLLFMFSILGFGQQQTVAYSIAPASFEESDAVTLTFFGNSINESAWGVTGQALYLWSWSFDLNDTNEDCPTNGSWNNSNEANKLIYNTASDTYSITFTPNAFYSRTGIGRMGFLIKAKDGSGDKKSQNILTEVGVFQATLTSLIENSTTVLNSGANLSVSATNTNGNASYNLKANGISLHSNTATSHYVFQHTNIVSNQNYELEITQNGTTLVKTFSVIINPNIANETLPADVVEGINYVAGDPSKAILVLDAPLKDFVYVAGSFNNWQPDTRYAMKKDTAPNSTKFWLELTDLTPGQVETYQYWVIDQTPIANAPVLVKTADPYSTLVLSPFDDPQIPTSTYPNLPAYPAGQEREVTVLQTNQSPYNWQIENFSKPKKEDLIIYEVLIRDFDANRSFQNLIDKIDYFKNLNINAIELMPVMEFEGNESWGYNTSFHMALDKFYGTEEKLKELIDVCHQNGIAVILDVALNHAFGRNPMVRMWMDDADGDGWGEPNVENPYFNQTAKHSYNVGSDFNHQSLKTQNYVKRVVKHWVENFKIDGFRWDLTKGFTQNCTSGDDTCTNSYQQDRVDVLKTYADYSWSLDETHYVIFEHLGSSVEERQWANYRMTEAVPKGVMMWSEMWTSYKNLAQGQTSNINFDRMGHKAHGFIGKRSLGYMESHDKDRIMYEMTQFGVSTNPSHNVKDLNIALKRMSALGAVTIPVPGPKMLWHFADLGMDNSIWTCESGVVNSDNDGNNNGDCKLATKPQPQWANNWMANTNRNQIYKDWSRLNRLKINEPVFEGDYNINSGTQTPRISIYTGSETASGNTLKNVVIIANFSVTSQNINPNFPYGGTWYDLMDASNATTVSGTTTSISLAPGAFKVFGNQAATLAVNNSIEPDVKLALYPNPTVRSFQVNKTLEAISIFDSTGKLVKTYKGYYKAGYMFDVSNLYPGIYFVKVKDKGGVLNTLKLIKVD